VHSSELRAKKRAVKRERQPSCSTHLSGDSAKQGVDQTFGGFAIRAGQEGASDGRQRCRVTREQFVFSLGEDVKTCGLPTRPTIHCHGCIIHGFKEQLTLSDADFPKDSNTEIQVLSDAIQDIWNHCTEKDVPPPDHITVQADNCSREMKNQFTILFGIFLILIGTVISITFNYLRKGHTHEDIGIPLCSDGASTPISPVGSKRPFKPTVGGIRWPDSRVSMAFIYFSPCCYW
jgi:hypothetical protein